ncbi:hypothetical protein F5B18DRAFT_640036, partial [Nemania serpens]
MALMILLYTILHSHTQVYSRLTSTQTANVTAYHYYLSEIQCAIMQGRTNHSSEREHTGGRLPSCMIVRLSLQGVNTCSLFNWH